MTPTVGPVRRTAFAGGYADLHRGCADSRTRGPSGPAAKQPGAGNINMSRRLSAHAHILYRVTRRDR